MELNTNRVGQIVAAILGGWHLLWSLLVAVGFAQPVLDFVFWVHMLKPAFAVEEFDFIKSALLVLITGGLGYAIGLAFAWLWNALHND